MCVCVCVIRVLAVTKSLCGYVSNQVLQGLFIYPLGKQCIYVYIYVCVCVCVCVIRVLIVTKSLCGYMSNQVQYNIESAQYQG